jgi:hypothetical protein
MKVKVFCSRITFVFMSLLFSHCWLFAQGHDPRNIATGSIIPDEGYCDQPYVVITKQGHWLCTMTTGPGEEGNDQQHVVSTSSTDNGKTWGPLVDIEPHGPPESSWVMPLIVPSGRVYAFYDYNGDNMREVMTSTGKPTKRVDTLGHYVFKYSDDGGQTWSNERYRIPIRTFQIDSENPYHGEVQFFWGVGKPIVAGGAAYIGLAKVGSFGKGFLERTEGIFLKSTNVLEETDPVKIVWETLPDGDTGLRAPAGPIAEEQNPTFLSDGSLFCTYRTTDGHPCHAYSRDGGHTWTPPEYMTYSPGGQVFKHPRAANFVRRFSNGKYLYWFHNHGGNTYDGRNPVWISGGIENDGKLHWSQPEILLYDDDRKTRMSYPDFIETGGRYYVTETQKTVARVHEIPKEILDAVWGQFDRKEVAKDALIVERKGDELNQEVSISVADARPNFDPIGISVDLWLDFHSIPNAPTELVSMELTSGVPASLSVRSDGGLTLKLQCGAQTQEILTESRVVTNGRHHVAVILEGGPGLALFVVDGRLLDGGTELQQGWHRIQSDLPLPNAGLSVRTFPNESVRIQALRFYARPILVSEIIGNHRAGS